MNLKVSVGKNFKIDYFKSLNSFNTISAPTHTPFTLPISAYANKVFAN